MAAMPSLFVSCGHAGRGATAVVATFVWQRRWLFGLVCLLVASACGCSSGGAIGTGGATAGGGAGGDGAIHVVLSGDYVPSIYGEGYNVVAGTIVEGGTSNPSADLQLRMTMVISLVTPNAPNGTLCLKGTDFQAVADIPREATGCIWSYVDLGGNAPHVESRYARRGYLLRDRDGTPLGRLLIVSDTVGPADHVEVAFDFQHD